MNHKVFQDFFNHIENYTLPLWFARGLDIENGGFFERMLPDGTMTDDPRRARVCSRQIYSFAAAKRMAIFEEAGAAVDHGLRWLRAHHLTDDNRVVPVVDKNGHPQALTFDLYDQAFCLFGLAAAHSMRDDQIGIATLADTIKHRMEEEWRHPSAGFEESRPRSLPLKANPHMHMLEASLAWEAETGKTQWSMLADEIVELCLARFLSPSTGALHEFFDGDWNIMSGTDEDVVEPGHQAEWAWLLIRWGQSRGRGDAISAAKQLIAIGEGEGRNERQQLLINELDPMLTVRDPRMRLWPQTERIKSLIALISITEQLKIRTQLEETLVEAVLGLMRYFDHPIQGSWWEHMDPDGNPIREPARASSLYHIMCAARELGRHLGRNE